MTFASPLALVSLLLVPAAAAGYVLFQRHRVRDSARFAEPALQPNIVDRVPGWRRHLPVAILLLAVAGFLVGFARPHATITVKSEEATVILAIDTSRSMGATDVAPTRLAAAQASARRFLADLPEKYRVAVVAFSTTAQVVAPPTQDREVVEAALGALRVGEATALGDALATAVDVAEGAPTPPGEQPSAALAANRPPTVILMLSDGAVDGGRITVDDAVDRAQKAKIPVFTALIGTEAGIVQVPHIGGYTERIQVPPNPEALRRVATQTGGRFYEAPAEDDLSVVYDNLKSRLGKKEKDEEITFAFAAGASALFLIGSGLSALWFRRVP
jgi:Ca-activated chloride channel homolog